MTTQQQRHRLMKTLSCPRQLKPSAQTQWRLNLVVVKHRVHLVYKSRSINSIILIGLINNSTRLLWVKFKKRIIMPRLSLCSTSGQTKALSQQKNVGVPKRRFISTRRNFPNKSKKTMKRS